MPQTPSEPDVVGTVGESTPHWPVAATAFRPRGPGYHLTEDLVDHAIGYPGDHLSATPDRPFFRYLAFGACHAPHQAPDGQIERCTGAFDTGWDAARQAQLRRQVGAGLFPAGTQLPPSNPLPRPAGRAAGHARRDRRARRPGCAQPVSTS